MITKKKLYWRKGDVTYSAHFHTNQFNGNPSSICRYFSWYGTYNIGSTSRTGTLYCPAYRNGTFTNKLCFYVGGYSWHVEDIIPQMTILSGCENIPIPYQCSYKTTYLSLEMKKGTINNAIELQIQGGTTLGGTAWVTVLTLPAGGEFVEQTTEVRYATATARLKIGSNWTSQTFSILGTAKINTVDIPEAQWGV